MVFLAQLLVVLGIGVSIALMIKPVLLKQHISFMSKGKRFYTAGVIKLTYGIIFLMAAPQAKLSWFVALFGLMCLVKGILAFVLKPDKIKSSCKWWMDKSEAFVRRFGMIMIVMGLVLLATL